LAGSPAASARIRERKAVDRIPARRIASPPSESKVTLAVCRQRESTARFQEHSFPVDMLAFRHNCPQNALIPLLQLRSKRIHGFE
jgi:hypothetical protein